MKLVNMNVRFPSGGPDGWDGLWGPGWPCYAWRCRAPSALGRWMSARAVKKCGPRRSWKYRSPKARWRRKKELCKGTVPQSAVALSVRTRCDTEIMNKLAPSPFWSWLVHRLFAFAIDFEFALLFGIDFPCTSWVIPIMGLNNLA